MAPGKARSCLLPFQRLLYLLSCEEHLNVYKVLKDTKRNKKLTNSRTAEPFVSCWKREMLCNQMRIRRRHLDAALSGQFHSRVVVATAQEVLHHHAVHAFLLPQVDRGWLVAAVLLQMLDATLAQFGTFIFCLNGLCGLWFTRAHTHKERS